MAQSYKISGVPVNFPGKPYPSQFSMMDRIIKGIERRQHCLLESPTGSGKSLALLCSSLAWLLKEKAKKNEEDQEEIEKATCVCACHVAETSPHAEPTPAPLSTKTDCLSNADKGVSVIDEDEDDVFKEDNTNFNRKQSDKKNTRKHISIEYEDEETKPPHLDHTNDCQQCSCSPNSNVVQRKIPKIFFGTRTHKQVAQIVRELGKTEYKEMKMTILGSREHTCIHPAVSKMKSKNEGCQELLNGPGCPYKDKVQRYLSHQVVASQGLPSAWDLEDLVKFSKRKKVCGYFLAHGLKEDADLVICPYNYLVDPLIREAISINLKGNVVILDEAHNIEDSAREAASQSIPQDNITAAIKDMEELMASHNLAEFSRLVYVLKQLDRFMEENRNNLEQKDFNQAYKIWNGFHIVAQLEAMGMGPKHFTLLQKALSQIKTDTEARKEEAVRTGRPNEEMKQITLNVLGQLFVVMDFLYRQDLKYADDYRASLVHSISYEPRHEENQWLNSRSRNGGRKMVQVETVTMNFWCMNPAVAFSNFVDTRSVILTSGTLSPMTSFQSELGLDFKVQLEANHIIKDPQVWVGSLGQGPNGTNLMAVYRNVESYSFQDELGQAIFHVCKTVPHGVLCFLPSYKLLDKLYTRWESTGLLDRVGERKKVFREPRSSSKEDFEEEIASYYRAVESSNDPEDSIDGAIMFAVCRGKISEGLDFADDYARAVISVGIPYPNFKDVQVELKRKYNDSHRQDRGLLSGSDWYDIQAFRALNQALGRCIRHRNDWGALIIIDDRFVKSAQKYTKGLSKWVRNKMCVHDNFARGMSSLKAFITRCKEEEQERKLNMSASELTTPVSPKACNLDTSLSNTADARSNGLVVKDEDVQCLGLNPETPKSGTPNARHFSIFNLANSHSNSSSKKTTKLPTLSSIAVGSTTTNQLPTAVVHPSFVIPPKPLAPVSTNINQLVNTNTVSHVGHGQFKQSTRHEQVGANASHHNKFVSPLNSAKSLTSTSKPLPLVSRNINASSGQLVQNANLTNSEKKMTVPFQYQSSKTTLRIITAIAPPGTRMQVFEIDPNLHQQFGGNLNLPVSTTERLVYVVEPPQTPGGNPLARIIKMSKEEKEKLAKESEMLSQLQQQQKITRVVSGPENPCNFPPNIPTTCQPPDRSVLQHSHAVSLLNDASSHSPALPFKKSLPHSGIVDNGMKLGHLNETSNRIDSDSDHKEVKKKTESNPSSNLRMCNTGGSLSSSTSPNRSHSTKEIQDSLEENKNSSCPLFDSPTATGEAPIYSHSIKLQQQQPSVNGVNHNGVSASSRNNQSTGDGNFILINSSKNEGFIRKNPLLKFLQTTDNANVSKTDTAKDSQPKSETSNSVVNNNNSDDTPTCALSTSNTSQDLFPSKEEEEEEDSDNVQLDVKISKTRKPLFKVSDKQLCGVDDGNQNDAVSSVKNSSSDRKCQSENVVKESISNNVRRSASKSIIESSPLAPTVGKEDDHLNGEEDGETSLKVRRKCGRKRRSLSLRAKDEDAKKLKSDLVDNDSAEEYTRI